MNQLFYKPICGEIGGRDGLSIIISVLLILTDSIGVSFRSSSLSDSSSDSSLVVRVRSAKRFRINSSSFSKRFFISSSISST